MDGLNLFPFFFLLSSSDTTSQKTLLRVLPAALPGPERLLVATLTARQQIRIEAEKEQSLVEEAIKAGELKNAADVAKFPALDAAFKRLPPTVRSGMFKKKT